MTTYHADICLESNRFSCDHLRIRRLTGSEAISRLFSFDLHIVSLDPEGPDPDLMLGARLTLVFEREGIESRRIHGVIVEVADQLADASELHGYRVRVAPRAQRLTQVSAHDVFVDATVPEIIESKAALLGLGADIELRLDGKYPRRELCVQYDETDLTFVSRLAEHLGVSFFFEHEDDRDRLIFTDNPAGFTPAEGTVSFRTRGEKRDVFALEVQRRVAPSYYAVRDYDYTKPLLDLTSQHQLRAQPGGVIEHGAHHRTPEEGRALARVRAEEQDSARRVYVGQSDLPSLAAGMEVRIEGHPAADPLDLLIIEVEHEASLVVADAGDEGAASYRNAFRAVPAGQAYRPPRATARPRIPGLVVGVIDPGPMGAEAFAPIDDQGRYRVRFLFDNAPPGSRAASGPVRMLQSSAGEGYGTHFPLRVGTEVLVGFVNGDPDRPVIVGAAPNPLKPSPVTSRNPAVNRIRTVSGITIDMVDEG
ncbi:VgrG protein [Minicystis rosea]|nr:VgrG protein [Minicystis rosea]